MDACMLGGTRDDEGEVGADVVHNIFYRQLPSLQLLVEPSMLPYLSAGRPEEGDAAGLDALDHDRNRPASTRPASATI